MKSLTVFVVFSIGFVIIYTVAEFIVSAMVGVHHDTLTTCVYTFFGTEIASCGLIKIFKIRRENNE